MKKLFAFQNALEVKKVFERKTLNVVSKKISLSAIKGVQFTYNPFFENTKSIREVAFQLGVPKRRLTNPSCSLKNDVRSDFLPPTMEVIFANGHKAIFKTASLSASEIIDKFNQLCTIHDPKLTLK